MALPKGRTNNPKGRPPNERSLTRLIEQALSKTVERDGKRVARKRLMADLLAKAVTEGVLEFEDRVERLSAQQWIDLVDRVLRQVDGPPRTQHDVNLEGGVVLICDLPIPKKSSYPS
jgi:hypothetical protein